MSYAVTEVQPPLEFIEPAFNPLVWRGARSLLPLWLPWRMKIPQVEVRNGEQLAQLYHQFQQGEVRFLVAFRHPSTSDPFCIVDLLWRQVPAIARQHQIPLRGVPHAHFVYDRGIPLWAGQSVGWAMSKLGGTPIRRGGLDRQGLRSIRHLFANGPFPMAAAPEGGTNGHNELVSPIEPGIAQFGFWCVEDLQKEQRSQQVVILPLGIQYHFTTAPWPAIDALLQTLEQDSGVAPVPRAIAPLRNGIPPTEEQLQWLYQRLYRLGQHLLVQMEQYYMRFYQHELPEPLVAALVEQQQRDPGAIANEELARRLHTLLNTALMVAEQFFQVKPKGNVIDRCRRVEQAGWDRIYRDDLQLSTLAPVEQGLADRIAEEADLRLWHMRLVENFVSVTGHYVQEKPTAERFADTLLLIWKTIARIKGDRAAKLPRLGSQRACLTVGKPLSVTQRWDEYRSDRRTAITHLTQDLQAGMESLVQH